MYVHLEYWQFLIIFYFFYPYIFLIIFENCFNILWMDITSVHVLQEADAEGGLTV